ncbi:taste receptor type 1 member 2 [Acomys russatus]|uniref:taste receptor type 1 member 2 n=1 Tax=Acomys russatus TaxID=60746 RepID=UPI0021E21597|nr:taste receptor type 1 member 2 [Acomys russatus]
MGPQARTLHLLFLLLHAQNKPVQLVENSDFHLAGDYLLGGLFSLHANVKSVSHLSYLHVPRCNEYNMKVLGYNLMQAMRFAVEEINNCSTLLPGVLLGYEMVDVCYLSNNIHPALYFLAQDDDFLPILNDYSQYVPHVVAVIGPDNSEATITVSNLLSHFLIPQVTYSAISDKLRDKRRFPAMLRTVSSATHHIEAMVQMMIHFHWNWIVVLASNDDYGRENSHLFSQRLINTGDICIAFQEVLPIPEPSQALRPEEQSHLDNILDKLWRTSARVVVVFSPELTLHNFFLEVLRWNFTGFVWIASESWAIDPALHNLTELRHTGTFLGVTTQRVSIPGFSEFRVRRAKPGYPMPNKTNLRATCNQDCDACLNITESFNNILMLSGERVVYSVYSAVYAVAHALHRFLHCNQVHCTKRMVYPWQLLGEIWQVNFTLLGNRLFFDQRGDMPMLLDIIQWQWDLSQNPFQSIASYSPTQKRLTYINNVSWHTPNNTIPVSMCSKSCQPGQMKKPIGLHPCCFECVDCPPGTYLNRSADEFNCLPCPGSMWSYKNDITCFKRHLAFLEWYDVSTIVVTILAAVGFFSTLAILLIFWRHLQTPMVRSAGGPMCFLMLVPLLLAFGMVPVYVGPPTVFSCFCRQAFFTVCFSVCLSCITVRSFQIVCVFKMARRLPRAYAFWLRCHGPYAFVAFITAIKMALVAGNMLATTINPIGRTDPEDPTIMILSCHPNYRNGLLLNTSMDLLLSVLGFSFAYLGKELPTNYNEAKFITLSMTFSFASSTSLCTFMSVHDGVLVTIMDLLVTVLNFLAIGLGYFGPKCYMILFYPERNTSAYFNSVIQGYTMRKS